MGILKAAKNMGIVHNVSFRVLDVATGMVVKEYSGHNQATNSMLLGIAHYLKGDGILNQGTSMLSNFVPKYISLGTMGLLSQEADEDGLPTGLPPKGEDFAYHKPGYGADGYDEATNNNREYFGLGPVFENRSDKSTTVDCELISPTFPRAPITYRQIVPETQAEYPETIDIIFSAMISTGALAQFREEGKDYIFISEAGLWSKKAYSDDYPNGLLAGYRLLPPDEKDRNDPEIQKKHILRVNKNQVVQVIWKVQLGSKEILGSNIHCDCTCKDRTNPDPNCPCHGNKTPVTPPVTTLVLNKHELQLNAGESERLIATVFPLQPVSWKSSDESVVYVDQNGNVEALGKGSATITATATDGSGASDSCTVTSKIDIPIGDLDSYTMFSTATLRLGARTVVYGENISIGSSINWDASDYGVSEGKIIGYSDTSKLYVWGDDLSDSNDPVITSRGGNYFDIAVYLPESVTTSFSNNPNSENDAFLKGRYNLDTSMPRPSIELLNPDDYITGTQEIDVNLNTLAIMTQERVILLKSSHDNSYTDDMGHTYEGYKYAGEILSAKTEYGSYGRLKFNSSKNEPAMCYVYPGKYAISGITQTGNEAQLRFKESTATKPTVFYVDGKMEFSNDTYISNDGDKMTCMVYCTDSFHAGVTNEMKLYLVAPNGEVRISNANSEESRILQGNIYAKSIYLENNIHFGIMEV